VTEAGFASELGAEKFFDIKCRMGGLTPDAVVIVATIRALKYHGGADAKELNNENVSALKDGLENLEKHIENMQEFGLKPIVAINKFVSDTDKEVNAVSEFCKNNNVDVALNDSWARGGEGAVELAEKVVKAVDDPDRNFKPLYELSASYEEKIETIATKIYGADGVEFSAKAKKQLRAIEKLELDDMPVCIAKTQKSLSDNAKLRGRPKNYKVSVREVELSSGAGFIVPIAGAIMRMPGLPSKPSAENIDIDINGNITGLF
ncbi:MAG TPA: formate--tetrahydrofolate ligase, partial [Bacteroidales bacterium]|nr:formate--tetrahydrofolate ligase [Bacteroidales bacterium]